MTVKPRFLSKETMLLQAWCSSNASSGFEWIQCGALLEMGASPKIWQPNLMTGGWYAIGEKINCFFNSLSCLSELQIVLWRLRFLLTSADHWSSSTRLRLDYRCIYIHFSSQITLYMNSFLTWYFRSTFFLHHDIVDLNGPNESTRKVKTRISR